jgi:hypothetical protein
MNQIAMFRCFVLHSRLQWFRFNRALERHVADSEVDWLLADAEAARTGPQPPSAAAD